MPEVVVTEIVVSAGAQIVHEVGATRRVVISAKNTVKIMKTWGDK